MGRKEVEQHIQEVIDGDKEPPGPPNRPACLYCGVLVSHEEVVKWKIPAGPGSNGGTNHYCCEEHKEQHKEEIIEEAIVNHG